MQKLFLILIFFFLSAQSIAGSCPDGSEPVKSISADGTYFVYNCGSSNTGGANSIIADFDGSYSFTISRYNKNDGSQSVGNGYIEINNGTMSVAKEGRTLDTGSIDLYDTFEGKIDKEGNISAVLNVNALVGKGSPKRIRFAGNIDASHIRGKFDHYFEMIINLKRGSYEGSPEAKLAEIKKSMDGDGILQVEEFSPLNAPHAINPVSVSDFSKIGKTSLRFESNDGECGQEPRWNDCPNDRERTELTYETEYWKTEKWYRFYLYLPKDYNSVAPAKMSLIQWKRLEPSKVLVMFQHTHAGLVLNRNAETFADSYIVLKPNEELLGNWTEIIFNTNWHPDSEKGVMKVWIDGKLKVDVKGRANINSLEGRELSLRYGLYSSFMSNYKKTFNTKKMPQRIAFYDGVKAENSCQKLLDSNTCNNLISQNINEYKLFIHDSNDKEMHLRSICNITPANFEASEQATLRGVEFNQGTGSDLCTYPKTSFKVKPIKKVGEAANNFDGAYAFIIRTEPDDGEKNIGTAQFIIKDGKISVARKYRYLLTSAISSYDTFEGVIDKEGNISASFELNPIRHMVEPKTIKFSGSMESLQLHGRFDEIKSWDNNTKEYVLDENFYPSFYDVIIDFKKENY